MSARRHLIAALSEDSMGGVATLQDVEQAEQLVAAHRTEVLAEVTAWLVKKAREFHAVGTRKSGYQANVISAMASKIHRGAVRPNNLRMLPPDFFQPGHTYQRRRWLFQCLAVAPNPFNGETRAVGYLYRPGEPATATALDPDDWEQGGWAETAEGGAE